MQNLESLMFELGLVNVAINIEFPYRLILPEISLLYCNDLILACGAHLLNVRNLDEDHCFCNVALLPCSFTLVAMEATLPVYTVGMHQKMSLFGTK